MCLDCLEVGYTLTEDRSNLYLHLFKKTHRGEFMVPDENNVILIPNIQEKLQVAGFEALQDKKFDIALENLNELLRCGVSSYEVCIGKIICLINLKSFNEALEFGEMLLARADENYIDYFDYYLMTLYEMELYYEVVIEIDHLESLHEIPAEYEEKFSMMYGLAKQMNQESFQLLFKKFNRAVLNLDHQLQWSYLHQLKERNIAPPSSLKELLMEESVHPVIKTCIFDWFQSSGATGKVEIGKFNQFIKVDFDSSPTWKKHQKYAAIHLAISDIEQSDPTLYQLISALLESYFYVNYPLVDKDETQTIAEALVCVAQNHLALETDSNVQESLKEYIELIQLSHELYVSIVPD